MAESFTDAKARYESALKKMQSGVTMLMNYSDMATPKHLRVGVNAAMVADAAILRILQKKLGVTEAEFMEALADEAELEVARYTAELEDIYGTKVTLGECGFPGGRT